MRSSRDVRDAALDPDREPQLRLDTGADAVERVDQRERHADRARRVVFTGDRQADDHADRAGLERARVERRVELERDVARDLMELRDHLLRALLADAPLERAEPAQEALDHVDVLARAHLFARRAGSRHRGVVVFAERAERQRHDGDRRRGRPARFVDGGGRPRARTPALLRDHLRQELRERAGVEQLALGLRPVELEASEVVLQIARGLVAIAPVIRERARDDALERVG